MISELVTEIRLRVNKEGMSFVAIDPANVALVSFKMPASVFTHLEAEDETLGLSLESLKSTLRRCKAGSSLTMKTEDNTLVIEISDKMKRTFSLALIDIEAEEKAVPNLNFSANIELSSNDFLEAVEDSAIVADSCSFICKEGKFIIEAKGLNSARTEFSGDEAKITGEDAHSRYSLEYLQKFAKATKMAEKAGMHFSDDYPLRMEFKDKDFEMVFILAPRVETEPY